MQSWLVNALVFSVILYASKSWSVHKADRSKINALEIWCWWQMLRVSWTEKRTNVSILREVGVQKRLSAVVLSRILKYFDLISRMEAMESLFIQEKEVERTRGRGWSPIRWTDSIQKAMSRSSLTHARLYQERIDVPSHWPSVTEGEWMVTSRCSLVRRYHTNKKILNLY